MATPPVGFGEAIFILERDGAARNSTITLGIDDQLFPTESAAGIAEELYHAISDTPGPFTAAQMLGGWVFRGVNYTYMSETGPIVGEYRAGSAGAAAGEPMPPNVSVLIRKTTASGGRRNRGRFYVPPVYPSEANVDRNGIIAGGSVATLQGAWDTFHARLITAELAPVLIHSEAPFTPTPILSFAVQSLVATQRRRLRK